MRGETYPEALLTEEIWMPRVPPKTASTESSFRVCWSPRKTRTGPLLFGIISLDRSVSLLPCKIRMLVCMERVLLIISCEFKAYDDKCEACERII